MASIIKIKRNSGVSTAAPSAGDLELGELAVNLMTRKLYVGNTYNNGATAGVVQVGGEDFRLTTTVADGEANLRFFDKNVDSFADGYENTANNIALVSGGGITIARQSNGAIAFTVGISADDITDGAVTNAKLENDHFTLAANTGTSGDIQLGDTLSIVSGDGTGITVDYASDTFTVSGVDATSTIKGVASFDSGDFSVSSGAVSIKTAGVGNAQLENDGITFAANTGSSAETTLGSTLSIKSGDGAGITTSISGSDITISGVDASSTVKGVAKFNSTDFSVSSGDVSLGTSVLKGLDGDSGSATGSSGSITIAGTSGEIVTSATGSTVTVGLDTNVTVAGTLDVTGVTNINDTTTSTDSTTGALVVDGGVGIAENLNVGGDVTISGDLTVAGTTTQVDSTTVTIGDSMLKLNDDNTADVTDSGVYAQYNDGTTRYSGYFRDADDDGVIKFYNNLTVEPGTTVDTSQASFFLADIEANNITGVIDGGTY